MKIRLIPLLLLVVASVSHAYEPTPLNQQILSLLREYSPDGIKIVEMLIANENSDNPVNPSKHLTTKPYTEQNIVKSLPVVVHESHHGLKRYGQRVVSDLVGRGDIAFLHDYYYFKEDDFTLVKITKTFPSRELVSLFPDSIQSRFYIYPMSRILLIFCRRSKVAYLVFYRNLTPITSAPGQQRICMDIMKNQVPKRTGSVF